MLRQPQEHYITVNSPWYEYIDNGSKIYEGRRYSDKVKHYQLGDTLIIKHHTDPLKPAIYRMIRDIHKYETFEQALTDFNNKGCLQQILPNIETIKEGCDIYKKYVSIETQLREGVCLIELKSCV